MNRSLWFPYAQMHASTDRPQVVSAEGCRLRLSDGRELIDGIASWWCVIHGYNRPELNAALERQMRDFAHVMLGGLTHEPAQRLADELVRITPAGLNHVFFSDSGSVAVEVALKMAVQHWRNRGQPRKSRFLALKGAYHGDTWMAMSVCDPDDGMHRLFQGPLARQEFVSPPAGYDASTEMIESALQDVRSVLARHAEDLAGFILEPILQAAGGFRIHNPDYLRGVRELCDEHDVLLIFDEIATGFGRTGRLFAAEHADITPDIMTVGKGLTAGYLGHAATLATDAVFEAFNGPDASNAFMHGPTFMANPLACAVALESLRLVEADRSLEQVARIEQILREELLPLKEIGHPGIRDVRILGATGAVEVTDSSVYQGFQDFALQRGVWLRPFDRSVYTMPPYVISEDELRQVTGVIRKWFEEQG